MNNNQISRVTIVGGGTAGWLAASLLSRIYRRSDGTSALDISVIESPTIPSIGVGEATVPAMPRILRQLGISERDFFRRCNASFKLCVRFNNWNVDENGQPVEFLNVFDPDPQLAGHDLAGYFTRFGKGRNSAYAGRDFVDTYSAVPRLVANCKGPRQIGVEEFSTAVHYAYHLDASLFANLLKETAQEHGVHFIPDDLIDVELDDRGHVAAIQLKEGGRHPVELVIDCTGFRSLILQKALGEPFVSYDKFLMNDRALAVQIPHPDIRQIPPCTGSTALGAGWVWRVPLYNRIGTGYVFSSKYRTDEQAIDEFLNHLDKTAEEAMPRVIPLRIGHARRSWVKNCIAIGLSSGFIEPLESTAIYSIEMAIRWLHSYFPDKNFDPVLSDRYNATVNNFYDELRDFISLHFHLNNRTDSDYWIAAREEAEIPDLLQENLAVWRHHLPTTNDLQSRHLFDSNVYRLVLISKGFYRDRQTINSMGLDEGIWQGFINEKKDTTDAIAEHMPNHYDLITAIRGDSGSAEDYQSTVAVPGALI